MDSFCKIYKADNVLLEPGIYISRVDQVGQEYFTTFDIRFTGPNKEPVIGGAEIHTLEHLGKEFWSKDSEWGKVFFYFGPRGSRTGFNLILVGSYASSDIVPAVKRMCEYILNLNDNVPKADAFHCGNYKDINLNMAQVFVERFYKEVLPRCEEGFRLEYPSVFD